MLKNYFKITLRNLLRHKGYSFINITGLAIGMACVIIIMLWVQHELTYDQFHHQPQDIYQILIENHRSEGIFTSPWLQYPLARALKEEYPEIIAASRIRGFYHMIRYQDKVFNEHKVIHAEPDLFRIATFPIIEGNPNQLLDTSPTMVISKQAAKKYFGDQPALGKILSLDNLTDVTITGVIDIPVKTDLQVDFIISTGIYKKGNHLFDYTLDDMEKDWKAMNYNALIRLAPYTDSQEFEKKISLFLKKYNPDRKEFIHIRPLSKVHLYQQDNTPGLIRYIYIFSLVALFVLVIACINFMNLTTARSSQRTKEIGIRKTIGAQRWQIIKQFYSESFLMAITSFIFALALVEATLPLFNQVSGRQLTLDFSNLSLLLGLASLILITGLLAGSYPALVLSTFQPTHILKASPTSSAQGKNLRRGLVIFQFTLSIGLIICTIIVSSQFKFLHNLHIGMDKENLVYQIMSGKSLDNIEPLKNELRRHPGIIDVTACQEMPFNMSCWAGYLSWEGKTDNQHVYFTYSVVDPDFFKTFKMKIIQGRGFSLDIPSDKEHFVINEEALRQMNLENPIGKKIKMWGHEGQIIGIVNNYNHRHAKYEIAPLILTMQPIAPKTYLVIRFNPVYTHDVIQTFQNTWNDINPGFAFDYHFADEDLDRVYKDEQRLGKLLQGFSLLAVFISCLGLFGLASFTAEQKTKEIGIRKALGATTPQIVIMLSRQFLKWIIIANIIAWPMAYYLMKQWLNQYVYRTGLNIGVFIFSGLLALMIAMLTISYQSTRAASANPVKALRYE